MQRFRLGFVIALALYPCCAAFGESPKPNVLFLAIDDLRNDVGALGAAHAKTPQLDAFAKTARLFSHHYVQVPTCGASRCALLRGKYPSLPAHLGNDAISKTQKDWAPASLPATFRNQGYRTLALGKISHHPGGRTGKDWAEGPEELPEAWDRCWVPESPWKTPQAMMHGYAEGVPRQPGKSPPWEAHDGPDDAYPDAWVAEEAVKTLKELSAEDQPWFFAVGFFKPHLPFAAPQNWHKLHAEFSFTLDPLAAAKPAWPSGWHGSGEFRGNYGHPPGKHPQTDSDYALLLRRSYAASVSYMDAQLGRVLSALEESEAGKNTIVVVWSDHGFLLGEHAIWGKHCLYEHALRSPLMIRHPGLPRPGETSEAIVETVDLFPTLADLCGLPAPPGLDGRSLRGQLSDPAAESEKHAHGFWTGGARTVRTGRWRLILHPGRGEEPKPELFDYQTDPQETKNHAAAHPEVVRELQFKLESAVGR